MVCAFSFFFFFLKWGILKWGKGLANVFVVGFINSGRYQYRDESGFNLDTQVLVFKVKLPKGVTPL